MDTDNAFFEYEQKLLEHSVRLAKRFINSKQYSDLNSKLADIDEEIAVLNREYKRKLRNLEEAKYNIEHFAIPEARNEYIKNNMESYKMRLKINQIGGDPIKAYMHVLHSES